MATATGDSKWITNKKARAFAHQLRHEADAVVIGLNTAVLDDPELTVRHVKRPQKHPLRIVVDPVAEIGLTAKILEPQLAQGTIVAVSSKAPEHRISRIQQTGAGVLICRGGRNKIALRDLFVKLARRGILYVLIEGGSAVLTSAFEAGLVDEVAFFYAPILIGGKNTPTPFEGKGSDKIKNCLRLKDIEKLNFDDNVLIRGLLINKGR